MRQWFWKPKPGIVYRSWIKGPKRSTGYNHWFKVRIKVNGRWYQGSFKVGNKETTIRIYPCGLYHKEEYEEFKVPAWRCKFKKETKVIPMSGQGRDWGKSTTYSLSILGKVKEIKEEN